MSLKKETLHNIYFEELAVAALKQVSDSISYSKVFVLVDTNTKEHCLSKFKAKCNFNIDQIIVIKPGEEYKTLQTCSIVWDALSTYDGDRKSILINLGGGVITDLGGFVASTFKRGIDFINIPTTLLAMVDASIGGKTGIDFQSLKNQIGVINQPKMVLIFSEFLSTLEQRQIKSGFAEMLKHGLISDHYYWTKLSQIDKLDAIGEHIKKSTEIKSNVVEQDLFETGLRKTLNFGHTLGHAIESYFLKEPNLSTLLHGEAIAIGMILEAYLSHEITGLSKVEFNEIKQILLKNFSRVTFSATDIDCIIELLKHDKKNSHGKVNFALLSTIGKCVVDVKIEAEILKKAFAYYAQ
jgi:3-dehydroquinate synthase